MQSKRITKRLFRNLSQEVYDFIGESDTNYVEVGDIVVSKMIDGSQYG